MKAFLVAGLIVISSGVLAAVQLDEAGVRMCISLSNTIDEDESKLK